MLFDAAAKHQRQTPRQALLQPRLCSLSATATPIKDTDTAGLHLLECVLVCTCRHRPCTRLNLKGICIMCAQKRHLEKTCPLGKACYAHFTASECFSEAAKTHYGANSSRENSYSRCARINGSIPNQIFKIQIHAGGKSYF